MLPSFLFVSGLDTFSLKLVDHSGYGIAVAITVVICFCIGAATYFLVRGQSINFFVAGKFIALTETPH